MKIGLQLPHFRPSTPESMRSWLKTTAQTADQGGFDSIWVMDHFFQLGGWLGEAEDVMYEGYTMLGFLAAVTEKVTIGLLVGGVIYRHPAVVIKMINTLDILSGGRAYFGIGAAWYEKETESLGMRFPPMKERFEQLKDILWIAHHMWSDNREPFEGTHTNMPYPVSSPQPLQKPHPPILIGGMGPTKTLRYVAKYADACNFFGNSENALLKERLDILQQHCQDLGRPYEEIEKTTLLTADLRDGSVDEVIERGRVLQEMGFGHLIFNIKNAYTPDNMAKFTDQIIPALKS